MMTRREFMRRSILWGCAPAVCAVDGYAVERRWLMVRELDLSAKRPDGPRHRIVHFTDTHYRGERRYLQTVIEKIHKATPDFVCFTGDIVDNPLYLEEALGLFQQIERPLFGVPGNHDYWNKVLMASIREAFAATGGAWLNNTAATTSDGHVHVEGLSVSKRKYETTIEPEADCRILMTHYPVLADTVPGKKFDLLLAGHSHGGQVRLPLIGAPVLPRMVGPYDLGLFETGAGPLYVNPGIGTWHLPVRFLCRPEITVITL